MITDRLMGYQANEHSEAILPRKFESSYSRAVESVQHERLCSLESVASEYSTLVARKWMSFFFQMAHRSQPYRVCKLVYYDSQAFEHSEPKHSS